MSQSIDYNAFKQALIRICIYGNEYLGGKSDEQLQYKNEIEEQRRISEARIRDRVKKKENDRKIFTEAVMAEMRAEFNEKMKKSKDGLGRSPSQNRKLANSQSETSIAAGKAITSTESDSVDE